MPDRAIGMVKLLDGEETISVATTLEELTNAFNEQRAVMSSC